MAAPLRGALPDAIDLSGMLSLPEAAACLARAALFVGNDSGLMHLAAAAGSADARAVRPHAGRRIRTGRPAHQRRYLPDGARGGSHDRRRSRRRASASRTHNPRGCHSKGRALRCLKRRRNSSRGGERPMKVGEAVAEIMKREGIEILCGYPVNHLHRIRGRGRHPADHGAPGAHRPAHGRRDLARHLRPQDRRLLHAARAGHRERLWRRRAGL